MGGTVPAWGRRHIDNIAKWEKGTQASQVQVNLYPIFRNFFRHTSFRCILYISNAYLGCIMQQGKVYDEGSKEVVGREPAIRLPKI